VQATSTLGSPSPPPCDEEGERVLAILAGESGHDCMYCGRVLAGEHDGWAHKRCEEVAAADHEANYVHDNGPLEKVERKLRKRGRCPYQIRAQGWDGGAIYCGRGIAGENDRFCLEHQCEFYGDDEGAAQERQERTLELLAASQNQK